MISVLHVDDEQGFLELTRAFLEHQGDIIVDGAPSTMEAIEMLKRHSYDVIVADYHMPGMDGLKLLAHARSRYGSIPFILFTGKGREEVAIQALNSGADFYLQKGGDARAQFAELEHKIRQAVERRKKAAALSLAEFSVDHATILTVWSDEKGHITKANMEAARQLGYSQEELVHMSLGDIDPTFTPEVLSGFWSELERKRQLSQESMMRTKDGRLVPVRFTANFLEMDGKKYNFAFGWDITEIKKAEESVAQSVASYRALAENLPGLVYRVHLRENERMQFFNDMLEPVTGFSTEEMAQREVSYLNSLIEPADRTAVLTLVREAVREGKPFEVEYRLRKKDGSVIYVSERGRPMNGADGLPLYIDGVIFDITSRRIDEERTRESERKFRELADLLPALVFEADAQGKLGFINETARAMIGYGREDLHHGLSLFELLKEPDRERAREQIRCVLRGERCEGEIFELLRKDGTTFPAAIHCVTVSRGIAGQGIRGLFVDVSAIRESERIQRATHAIAQSAMSDSTLEEVYSHIHSSLRDLVPLDNFFIALYDEERDELSFPYFVDRKDPAPQPRRKGRGITEYVLRTREPLLIDTAGIEALNERGEIELIGTPPVDFLAAPLLIHGRSIGLMATQSYNPEVRFSPKHMEMLSFVSGQVAMAIQRKRQETELKRYVGLLQTTFESTNDGLLIVDMKGKALAWNDRFVRMWGIPEGVLQTRDDQRMLDFIMDQLRDPEAFRGRVRELYSQPGLTSFDIVNFKDDRYFERYSQPFSLDGEVVGRIWSFRDVTERTWAEAARSKSERELKYIINSAKDAIFVKDQEGRYTMANEAMASLFKLPVENFKGLREEDVFEPETATANSRTDQEVLDGRTVEEEVVWNIMGAPHTFSVVKVPLRDEQGRVFGICGIARDTTEHKNVEKALKEANESLNLLSSITRHDVLNQLMIIRGYSDLVRASLKDQKQLEYMDKVERATRNIRQQILFTRDFQRLGAVAPRWQIVEELLDKVLTTLEIEKVDISVDLGGLELLADPMLEKVFYNYVDNTLRHGEKATRISVTCSRRGNDLLLVYEDDGIGIQPSDKERIFERGFGRNTGLGLFMVRLVLNVSGIQVRETGEHGKGARFEMLVPDGAYRFREWDDSEH